jgi:predicted dehydrogenase
MSNGLMFTYRGSWCSEGCTTGWNGDWRIIGDSGTLIYEQDKTLLGQVVDGDEGFMRPLKDLTISELPLRAESQHGGLLEMLDFLRTGKTPVTECHDNIRSLAMVFSAIESSKQGKRVLIPAG